MEKRQERQDTAPKPLKKNLYNPLNFGPASATGIMDGLYGDNPQIAVLSYLPYRDLVNVAQMSRSAYNFIIPRETRRKILCWKPSKEDETKMHNYPIPEWYPLSNIRFLREELH